MKEDDLKVEKIKQQKRCKGLTSDIQKIRESISDDYERIEGAQLSNSFMFVMTLYKARRIYNSLTLTRL